MMYYDVLYVLRVSTGVAKRPPLHCPLRSSILFDLLAFQEVPKTVPNMLHEAGAGSGCGNAEAKRRSGAGSGPGPCAIPADLPTRPTTWPRLVELI